MSKENALALLHIEAPDGMVRTEPIMHTPLSIGRVEGNDLVLPDPKVSRNHARLLFEGDRIVLIDLKSTNGTTVGGSQLQANQPYVLGYGEEFQIGSYTLRLAPAPAGVTEPAPEASGDTALIPEMPQLPGELLPETAPSPGTGPAPVVEPAPEPEPPPVRLGVTGAPPPPPPSEPPPPAGPELPRYDEAFGLPADKSRYLRHLPPIYEEDPFLSRFLLVFEGVLTPIEQTVDNFDLFLDPRTAPTFFLTQLAGWLGMPLDEKWPEHRRRALLAGATELYRRRGTRWGLCRQLEIYTDVVPEITEPAERPHHFHVLLRVPAGGTVDRATVERIIQANKPAHSTYSLEILEKRQ